MTQPQSLIVQLCAASSAVEHAQRARLEVIREALKAGMTQHDIAFWSSVSRRTVSDIAKTLCSEQAAS